MDVEQIRKRFYGYHVEIELYPSGGRLECIGCEECGTAEDRFETALWRMGRPGWPQTIEDAVVALEERMRKRYGPDWQPPCVYPVQED